MLGTSEAWSTSRWTSGPVYYIVDCQISELCAQPSYRMLQACVTLIDVKQQTKYIKGNEYIIYLKFIKYVFMKNPPY